MKHIVNPLETTWYYVTVFGDYFPYIEHRVNGILLDGSKYGLTCFVVPFKGCRKATYEEARQLNNR
jgi:hypothetical protein